MAYLREKPAREVGATRAGPVYIEELESEDDPESGAFPKIARAVGYAAINFGETEDVVAKMFASLSEGLAAPPGTPQPPTRDEHDGPVTESTPPW